MNALERELMIARIDNRINAVLSYELYLAKLISKVLGRDREAVKDLDEQSTSFVNELFEGIKKADKEFDDILKIIDRRD